MVDLVRLPVAHFAERALYLLGMLARCNTVCVQAVNVPADLDVRGWLIAPVTDPVSGRLSPPCSPVDEPSGMLRRMPSVVQHETSELALPDGSFYELFPRGNCRGNEGMSLWKRFLQVFQNTPLTPVRYTK